jgi:hypothetical protein
MPMGTSRVIPIPPGAYVKFVNAGESEAALLDFANRFGPLGIPLQHFHIADGLVTWEESLRDWRREHDEFLKMFEAWSAVGNRNLRAATELQKKHGGSEFWKGVSVWDAATLIVVNQVSQHLTPTQLHHIGRCPVGGCELNDREPQGVITPHVQCSLETHRDRASEPLKPQLKIHGRSLISGM